MRFWAFLQSGHIAGHPKAPFGRFSCAGRTEFDLDSPIVLRRPAIETAFSGTLSGDVESVQNSSAGRAETAQRLSHRASPSEIVLSTRAGTPPTTVIGGTSFVTTAPAATTAQSPSVTPGRMVAFEPIQTFSPMRMGA